MILLCAIVGYLLGSVSTSTLVVRWAADLDIRQHGSGNAGATNTLRVLGLRYALLVLAVDILKGMAAVGIAEVLGHGHPWAVYAAGLAAIAGHNWPVFFGFRGGKGVATTIGVLALVMFTPAAITGAIAILMVVLTRYVSLGAMTFTVLTPVAALLLGYPWPKVAFAVVIAALSIFRHRQNIGRLWRGEEHKVFSKS
ncbi:MAG: glycerol-3-phosphate 1-O-acyltransferase PlsY [Alicyclobacillus macrosporangiidus]|uniref:glycerol-3-phosphate 1-O-acyltransferase PlsY n=1 Tax=Alicyclobacillus macrosporangiidus TaxID=392015 RepID=UPI0026EE18E5|nr:glycerol-3-phosphate 1-O-acyltransferase PlsY [Alicyclobacillus macrosporangiidus]MCL6598425.1 glycerol-3-phosphate 1-O-acyltransferase PlsY [Alicyclobacillus macrosporangiidus]